MHKWATHSPWATWSAQGPKCNPQHACRPSYLKLCVGMHSFVIEESYLQNCSLGILRQGCLMDRTGFSMKGEMCNPDYVKLQLNQGKLRKRLQNYMLLIPIRLKYTSCIWCLPILKVHLAWIKTDSTTLTKGKLKALNANEQSHTSEQVKLSSYLLKQHWYIFCSIHFTF